MNNHFEKQSNDQRESLPSNPYFSCLGHDHGVFAFHVNATGEVRGFTADQFRACHFFELAPLAWWIKAFPVQTIAGGFDWAATFCTVADALIGKCYQEGVHVIK